MTNSELELSPRAQEARRRYMRNWRARNQERIKRTSARYWEKKAEELKEAVDFEG